MMPSTGLQAITDLGLRFLPVLLASSLKASIILAIIYAATRLMRHLHPQLRYLLWLSAILSYLLVLALSVSGPIVRLGGLETFKRRGGILGFASAVLLPASGTLVSPGSAAGGAPSLGSTPLLVSPRIRVWSSAALVIWVAGFLTSSARVILGRFRLLRFTEKPGRHGLQRQERLLRQLAARIGIKRKIRVWESPDCAAPFTARLVHPIVVLPAIIRSWPDERLRAVLLHELHHIRRLDCLTQAVTYAICSLFWFVPPIWMAYAQLYLEQEKACDVEVVQSGMERPAYAACILDAARLCRKPALLAGLFFSGRRKRVLADRIHSIIRGGKAMKKGLVFFVLVTLVAGALVVLSGAGQSETISDKEVWAEFVGEWINMDYQGVDPFHQRTVIKSGYVGEDWEKPSDSAAYGGWEVKPKKHWTDENGGTYFQVYLVYTAGKWKGNKSVALMRIDKAGKVLEINARCATSEDEAYPQRIDPEFFRSRSGGSYFIYYRR